MGRAPVIVLTGGPGGGKSTLMRELRAEDLYARRWLLIFLKLCPCCSRLAWTRAKRVFNEQ